MSSRFLPVRMEPLQYLKIFFVNRYINADFYCGKNYSVSCIESTIVNNSVNCYLHMFYGLFRKWTAYSNSMNVLSLAKTFTLCSRMISKYCLSSLELRMLFLEEVYATIYKLPGSDPYERYQSMLCPLVYSDWIPPIACVNHITNAVAKYQLSIVFPGSRITSLDKKCANIILLLYLMFEIP